MLHELNMYTLYVKFEGQNVFCPHVVNNEKVTSTSARLNIMALHMMYQTGCVVSEQRTHKTQCDVLIIGTEC